MTKHVSALEDLCLDSSLSFTIDSSIAPHTWLIIPESNSEATFDRIKNGSYIKYWNDDESKKGIAIYGKLETGPNAGSRYIRIIIQNQNSPQVGDTLSTISYFNKNYKFLNEYQTLQDILEYFQNPTDVNNNVDFILDNGNLSSDKGVLMVEPYNSRHILMSPTQESKLARLPYVISMYQGFLVDGRVPVFYIKRDVPELCRIFRVRGYVGETGEQICFDLDVDLYDTHNLTHITLYNHSRSLEIGVFICERKASNDDWYIQVCFQSKEGAICTIEELYIETQYPNHIKYDINPYPNAQNFLGWSRDVIEINPRFLMADTFGNYVQIDGGGDGYYQLIVYEGVTRTILASEHNRGAMPIVECYGIEMNVKRKLTTELLVNDQGDVEVTWNGGVSLEYPVLIIIR